MVIRRIIRNLLVLVLVTAAMQSGMAQWPPCSGADVIRAEGMSSSHPGHRHGESHAHGGLPDANGEAPPKEAHFNRCVRPSIGCDCPCCLGYFEAHSLALPAIAASPLIPRPAAHENSVIALLVDTDSPPPTPPPRS
jgi:hypothetical protein